MMTRSRSPWYGSAWWASQDGNSSHEWSRPHKVRVSGEDGFDVVKDIVHRPNDDGVRSHGVRPSPVVNEERLQQEHTSAILKCKAGLHPGATLRRRLHDHGGCRVTAH